MPKHSLPGQRDIGLSGGAGKGDAERSAGWREHYDEIEWTPRENKWDGFQRGTMGFRKVYRPEKPPTREVASE